MLAPAICFLEIRTDAKSVANIALPEMKAYGEAMRKYIFMDTSSDRGILARIPPDSQSGAPAKLAASQAASSPLESLARVAAQITEGDRYTPQQRNEALRLLREIKRAGLASDDTFPDTLELLLDAFVSSDQNRSVDYIDEAFSDQIKLHAGMLRSILIFHGIRMLGEVPDSARAEKRFVFYAKAATDQGLRTTAIHPLMVLHHSRGEKAEVDSLLGELKAMDEVDRMDVHESLDTRADPYRVMRRPDAAARRMAEKYRRFMDEYASQLQLKDM